ncbi:MAG TPA: hypothetical protein VF230_11570 [Acidimicrobiales bacterium]
MLRGGRKALIVVGGPAILLALGAVASLAGASAPASIIRGDPLATAESFALPLATFAVVLYLHNRYTSAGGSSAFLRRVARDLPALLAVNAVVAVLTITTTTSGWLEPFWSTRPSEAVASRALLQGRASGVFNQPLEAGLAYSVGLLLVVVSFQLRWSSRRRSAAIAALLVVGGSASISKAFIIGGLPVSMLVFAWPARSRATARLRSAMPRAILVGWSVILAYLVATLLRVQVSLGAWSGFRAFRRLVRIDADGGSSIQLLSGGRNTSLQGPWEIVGSASPLIGFGLGSARSFPTDSAWIEAFVVAGAFGIAAMALHFGFLLRAVIRAEFPSRVIRRGAVGIMVVCAATSFGGPVFTGNRSGTIVVIALASMLLTRASRSTQLRDREHESPPGPSGRPLTLGKHSSVMTRGDMQRSSGERPNRCAFGSGVGGRSDKAHRPMAPHPARRRNPPLR